MTDATRAIVDYAEEDNAKEMRNAFYNELQNRVMAHIENKKMEVAKSMFNNSQQQDSVEPVEDEEVTPQ
jgi:hypothetical protein